MNIVYVNNLEMNNKKKDVRENINEWLHLNLIKHSP